MSFKAKRQPLGQRILTQACVPTTVKPTLPTGVRPSPLDGRPTTSTGTRSLDSLLAGHMGLALGSLLLIGEIGTTDYSGCLLKYYAAEGAVQGHQVHVLGVNDIWGRELPGITSETNSPKKTNELTSSPDKMKIAWRYERLGEFGAEASESPVALPGKSSSVFCHDFDLSQRLAPSSHSNIKFVPIVSFKEHKTHNSPFLSFLSHIISQLENSSPDSIHRVVIPSILSPVFYPSEFCNAEDTLQFFHILRALLRRYKTRLTAIISLPLTFYPRSTGLTRWMEILSDGVLELAPLPPTAVITKISQSASPVQDETPQGFLKIHKLPIFHEKGGGGTARGLGDDLAFTLSRRKGLIIKPFSLPPVEGDNDTNKDGPGNEKEKFAKEDIQF